MPLVALPSDWFQGWTEAIRAQGSLGPLGVVRGPTLNVRRWRIGCVRGRVGFHDPVVGHLDRVVALGARSRGVIGWNLRVEEKEERTGVDGCLYGPLCSLWKGETVKEASAASR